MNWLGKKFKQHHIDHLGTTVTSSQGNGMFKSSKEDRILNIQNLEQFTLTPYDTTPFGDTQPSSPCTDYRFGNEEPAIFKLFAVFDGHCGCLASSFLAYRFPFELVGTEEFKAGNFKQALLVTFENLHMELLNCSKYAPEGPAGDYSSGSTASVAMVTPEKTYFAFLGDSPIIIWEKSQEKPRLLVQEHDATNLKVIQNLKKSNGFLVLMKQQFKNMEKTLNYYMVRDRNLKASVCDRLEAIRKNKAVLHSVYHQEPLEEIVFPEFEFDEYEEHITPPHLSSVLPLTEEILHLPGKTLYEEVRVGLAALNVFGSIGDSSYDPHVFNCLVDHIVAYRDLKRSPSTPVVRKKKCKSEKREDISIEPPVVNLGLPVTPSSTSSLTVIPQVDPTDTQSKKVSSVKEGFEFAQDGKFVYSEFRNFIMDSKQWSFLSKHFRFPEQESELSKVMQSFLYHANESDKLRNSLLLRVPEVVQVDTCDLRLFVLASDGVVRFYDHLYPMYQRIIVKHHQNVHKLVDVLKNYVKWLKDDRSLVVYKLEDKPGSSIPTKNIRIVPSKEVYSLMMIDPNLLDLNDGF